MLVPVAPAVKQMLGCLYAKIVYILIKSLLLLAVDEIAQVLTVCP